MDILSELRACNIVQAHTKVINDLKTPFTLVHPLLQLVYFQLHTRNSVGGLNSYLPAEQIYVSFRGGWHGNLYICAHILAVEYIYECRGEMFRTQGRPEYMPAGNFHRE